MGDPATRSLLPAPDTNEGGDAMIKDKRVADMPTKVMDLYAQLALDVQ